MLKRILSIVLTVFMLIALLPTDVSADGADPQENKAETVETAEPEDVETDETAEPEAAETVETAEPEAAETDETTESEELLPQADSRPPVTTNSSSGTCGDSLNWSFDDSVGVLTITGSGEMADYTGGTAPWYGERDRIIKVVFPDALTSIGEYAFYACKALETIDFGTGLTEIGRYVFYDCDGLTTITLPDGVASLGSNAFAYSNALTSFTFGTGFATFYNSDGYGTYPLDGCSALKEVTFTGTIPPDGPYYSGFRDNSSLETVYVPSESYEAYVEAFRSYLPNNAKLQPITTAAEYEIKDGVLIAYVGEGGDIVVPNGVTEIGADAFYNNKTIGRVTLPEGVTTVSYSAFRGSSVTEIALPTTLTTIGNYAFYRCASLTALKTPDALTSIGEYAFYACKALETIDFGTGLTEIGRYAFYDCDGLTTVTLPDGVASLGSNAFAYSNALTSFTFGTGFATFYNSDGYGTYPLDGCSALKEVTFTGTIPPDGPYYSGFRDNSSLETVYVPSESYAAYVEAFRNYVPSGTVFATNDYYNISVSGLHAEQTFGRSVVLTWNSHASAAITQYQIRYGETVLTTEETRIRIGGLEPDTAYSFTVTGLDAQGKPTKAATTTASTVTPMITALAEARNREKLLPGVYTFFVTVQNDGNLAAPFDGGNALGGMLRWEDAQGNILKTVNLSADVETMGRFAAELDLSDTESGIYTLHAAVTDPDGVSAELTKTISVDASTPTAVRNFHAAGDLTEITLTWSTAVEASVTGYRIYRSPASEAAFTVLATVNGRNTLIYHDTSAAENQEYAYYIVALGSLGQEGTACETVTAARIADTEKPQVTRISPANNSRINGAVTFHATAIDNVAVASVAYEYSLNEGNTWVGFNGTLDTTVLRDGSLYVRATATDRSGNVSDPLRYVYMMDNTGPEQVTGLYGESTSVTITLHWNDVSDDDIRFYRVERLEDGSYRTELDSYMTLGANLYGLTPDTEYTFRVVGYDTLGNRGIPSDPVTVRTGSDETAPVITRILPSPGYYSSSIPISVTAEDDYCVRTITVQTSRNGADWTDCITETYSDVSRVQTASVDLDLSTLDEGVLYVRGICADAAGNVSTTGEDAPYTQYMIDKTAPAAPSGVTATGGCGYIELAWEQGSEHDLGTYSIYRAPYANASYSLLASGLSTLNYVDRTVAPGTTWFYRLTVSDITGNVSAYSETVSATAAADTEAPQIISISPADGSTLGSGYRTVSVLAWDNHLLASLTIEYSTDGETYESLLTESDLNTYSVTRSAVVPLSALDGFAKIYIRAYAADRSGNTSETAAASYSVDRIAPSVSAVTAEWTDGAVQLRWNGGGENDLTGYRIYRRTADEIDGYCLIGQRAAVENQTAYSLIDQSVSLQPISYVYKIEAVDLYGNTSFAETDPITLPDRSAPVPVLHCDSVMEVGTEYVFDASQSTDDSAIVEYRIDFGDGCTTGMPTSLHAYDAIGAYTVTLSVTDDSGNTAVLEKKITVKDPAQIGTAKICIVDENGSPVPGAYVYFDLGYTDQAVKSTDGNGCAEFTAEAGAHTVGSIIPDNEWLPVKGEIIVHVGTESTLTMTLVHEPMIEGTFDIQRMTFDEIVAAGIDITDPANQYLVTVTVHLRYEGISYVQNTVINPQQSVHPLPSMTFGDYTAYPILFTPSINIGTSSENGGADGSGSVGAEDYTGQWFSSHSALAYVIIPVNVSTLKEFFNVELNIVNHAGSDFSMTNNLISLNIPEGLSLMDSASGSAGAVVTIDEIQGQTSRKIRWILRGDQVGEYYLSADYSGVLSEFNQPFSAQFKSTEPITVKGLSDMKLTVMVPDYWASNALYYATVLSNHGDEDVYQPHLSTEDTLLAAKYFYEPGLDILNVNSAILGVMRDYDDASTALAPDYAIAKYYRIGDPDFPLGGGGSLADYYYSVAETYGLQIEIVVVPLSYFRELFEIPNDGEYAFEVSGILRHGDGWNILWKVLYNADDQASVINAFLQVYMEGSNAEDGRQPLYSELPNCFMMPWLTEEYGFKKADFDRILIYGGTVNPFEVVSNQFSGYENVKTIQITNVQTIQSNGFRSCTNLNTLIYDSRLSFVGKAAFRDDTTLSKLYCFTVASNIKTVSDEAFMNTALDRFAAGSMLEVIGECAFMNTPLNVITFNNKLRLIDDYAFANTKLVEVSIPNNIESIGTGAFMDSGLSTAYIGDDNASNVSIGERAFEDCPNLVIYCYKDTTAHMYAQYNNIYYILPNIKSGEVIATLPKPFEYFVQATGTTVYNSQLSYYLCCLSTCVYNEADYDTTMRNLRFTILKKEFRDSWGQTLSGYGISDTIAKDGTRIVLITIRGSVGYNWNNLLDLGVSMYGLGKYPAMEKDATAIYDAMLECLGNSLPIHNTVYVITGHSQGAGAGNLLACKLYDNGIPSSIVYDYNFACPNVACLINQWDWNPGGVHNNIFNIGNIEDPVTLIPDNTVHKFANPLVNIVSAWGKFGRSYWFQPSTAHNAIGHDLSVYRAELATDPHLYTLAEITVLRSIPFKCLAFFCPVDIIIYDGNGSPVAGISGDTPNYYDSDPSEVMIAYDSGHKVFYLPADRDYSVRLNATEEGTMTYLALDLNNQTGEPSGMILFENVSLTQGKAMASYVDHDIPIEEIRLLVLDENGTPIAEIHEDGTETPLVQTIEGVIEWNAEDVKFKGSTPYVICNGSAQTPRFTVKNAADGSVVDPENYDYEYRENTDAGTGYVIVTFKGDYSGTAQGWFKIYLPATEYTYVENVSNGIKVTWDPVEGAAGYVIYRRAWSSTTNGWTDFVRWYNVTGTEWIDGSDVNHKVYAGSRYQYGVKAYFARRTDPVSGATIGGNVGDNFNLGEVGPLKTTVRITTRKLVQVRPGSKQMTVKWEASKNFTGYQIKYATDANFTKNVKAIKISDPTTYWTTIKSLQSNTTYYVCIRSYHEFGGMTYFGEWSNVLSCKVK